MTIVTADTIDPKAKTEELPEVKPSDLVAEVNEPVLVNEEAPAEEAPEVKKYTREELDPMNRGELREIAAQYGIKGKSIEKLISDILDAQDDAE